MNSDHDQSSLQSNSGQFARSRWAHVLTLADQLRQNTELQKNEHLRQYAFEIPSDSPQGQNNAAAAHSQTVKSFEDALLFAKTGNFNLDNLSDKFLELKKTFNHMLELNKNDIHQVTLATSITKSALLIILRAIESIIEVITKGTRNFPTLYSLIAYVRAPANELPINGRLLVEWYNAADVLDLLVNDSDWLVRPKKAQWAIQICDETLIWTRGVFNENFRPKSMKRPIFDRDDSIIVPDSKN